MTVLVYKMIYSTDPIEVWVAGTARLEKDILNESYRSLCCNWFSLVSCVDLIF